MSLLSCPLCLKPHFPGVDALRTSLISVATTNISCPVCNELFLGLDKLTIHLFSHISSGSNRVAQESKDQNYSSNSTGNKQDGEEKKYPVQNYSNSFNNEQDVEMGDLIESSILVVQQNDSLKDNPVVCDICNCHFSDDAVLDMHQKLLHQTTPDKKTGKCTYHCHLCNKQFKMRGSLVVHLRVAHFAFIQSNRLSIPNQMGSKKEDTRTTQATGSPSRKEQPTIQKRLFQPGVLPLEKRKVQDNKQWECDVCLKLFTTKYFLKKHKRLHTGEMPYYCVQCNKYFTFQQSYHKHMLYHSDDKPHVCSDCGRAFKELSTLHNHERIHSGERPFSCETCGKCFRQRVSYLVHRRIHTGVMPYKCTACNKSFRYKVSQRSHKCPINPPGCVVRTTPALVEKLIQNQSSSQKSIEINTQSLSMDCDNVNVDVAYVNNVSISEEKNPHLNEKSNSAYDYVTINNIQMQVNKSGSLSASTTPNKGSKLSEDRVHSSTFSSRSPDSVVESPTFINNSESPDFFSLVLSPVLSDVKSLCLTTYPDTQSDSKKENSETKNHSLQTINEESFKELLYGLSETK